MAGDAVQVIGLERLTASLDRLSDELGEVSPNQAGTVIGAAARMRAPKRSGRLSSSFRSSSESGVLKVSFGVPYAGPIEFGVGPRTGLRGPHNIRATHFLNDAITQTRDQWLNAYADDVQGLCDQVKGA